MIQLLLAWRERLCLTALIIGVMIAAVLELMG